MKSVHQTEKWVEKELKRKWFNKSGDLFPTKIEIPNNLSSNGISK